MTATLPSRCSWAIPPADGCQCSRGSSLKTVPAPGDSASWGRSFRYTGSATGARNDSVSIPPGRNTCSSTGPEGDEPVAGDAADARAPPEGQGGVDRLLRSLGRRIGGLGRVRVQRAVLERVVGRPPVPAPGGGVQPAGVVPAGDVRRVERQLAG